MEVGILRDTDVEDVSTHEDGARDDEASTDMGRACEYDEHARPTDSSTSAAFRIPHTASELDMEQ